MLVTASLTLLSLAFSAVLALSGVGSPLAVVHLAFAVGIVPLIFAAMSHFVPVLTRTGNPSLTIARVPRMAQLAGLVAVFAMQGTIPRWMVSRFAADKLHELDARGWPQRVPIDAIWSRQRPLGRAGTWLLQEMLAPPGIS